MTLARKSPPLREILRDRRFALMLALGFSSGLPFLLIFSTQSAWLREAGVSRSAIGLMSYAALAFTFKFAWAPLSTNTIRRSSAAGSGAGAAGC
jgi:PAT family beta-lactamase induction signal transducer AmpG